MTPGIRPLMAGNWKMNGTAGALGALKAIADGLDTRLDALICVPATLLSRARDTLGASSSLAIGGEDCHAQPSGAHTGDISAEMIADCGASHVIVGHSERRADHGEDDAVVSAKASAAWRAGLVAIVCIGETEAQRKADETIAVLSRQLAGSLPDGATAENTVVAYEPVWAIGTGLTPSLDDIADAHAHMRTTLVERFAQEGKSMRLLYGGSVKPGNAGEILAIENVDGALIGGASLKSADFLAIARACPQG